MYPKLSKDEQNRRAHQRTISEIERQPRVDPRKLSESEQQRRARQRAMSISQFCKRYGIGRTKAYDELRMGRLRGHKCGNRTLIANDDAEQWLSSLPPANLAV
jgi:excisionase family DNA binding protein